MASNNSVKTIRKKVTKKLKDANAPKAPLTPYLKFGNEQRKKDPKISSLPVGEQGKMLSELWKNLDVDSKEKMKADYATEKEEYNKKVEEYKKTDCYQDFMKQKEKLKDVSGKKKKRVNQSAYNVYFKERYPQVASQNKGAAMKDITAEVAKQWKIMTEEDKKVYKDKADAINQEYKDNMKAKEEEDDMSIEDSDED